MIRGAFRRLLALDDPPERTALAFSIGVLIGFSPFLGLHTIMAALAAFVAIHLVMVALVPRTLLHMVRGR